MKIFNQLALLITMFLLALACSKNTGNSEIQNSDSINKINNNKIKNVVVFDSIAGRNIYESKCIVCHQANGMGVSGTFPPLANSDYLLVDKKRAIRQIRYGAKEPIIVNGVKYRGNTMPEIELTDPQLKDVVNYILNSWGNKGGMITPEDIREAQKKVE